MIHGVIARTAAVTPAPPMERKAVRTVEPVILSLRSILALRAILTVRAIRPLTVLWGLRLRLTAGDERRQPFDVALGFRRHLLRARLELLRLRLMLLRLVLLRLIGLRLIMLLVVLRLIMLLVMLRLIMLWLARIERLGLARRERLAGHGRLVAIVIVAVVGIVTHAPAGLLLREWLALTKLFLRGGDQAEIMFGVLIIIFGGDRISGTLRIAGELEILFGDVRRRSANFYVLPIGLVHSG